VGQSVRGFVRGRMTIKQLENSSKVKPLEVIVVAPLTYQSHEHRGFSPVNLVHDKIGNRLNGFPTNRKHRSPG